MLKAIAAALLVIVLGLVGAAAYYYSCRLEPYPVPALPFIGLLASEHGEEREHQCAA